MASQRPSFWIHLGLLWLAGIDLRLTILAVPPVLPLIHRDLELSETAVAALTGLPVLLFALVAVPGSLLIARLGARRAVILGLGAVALASAARGIGPAAAMLFAMTFAMGAGVAVIQPALPALVGRWFPAQAALATAVYANGLLIGEALPASLTIGWVLPLMRGSWEGSFVFWAIPVLLSAGLFLALTPHDADRADAPRVRWWPDWRDARTWRLGLLQGGGSALYFAGNAFLPDYLQATARPELIEACLAAMNVGQLPASFIVLLLARRLGGKWQPLLLAGVAAFLAYGSLLMASPAGMIIAAGAIGFCGAFVLILTLALPPLLAAPGDVHRLSAGMFAISYSVAFLVPLLGGAVWDVSGLTAAAFLPGALGALIVMGMATNLPRK